MDKLRVTLAIYFKELSAYFRSPLFYTLSFFYTVLLSIQFLRSLFTFASAQAGMEVLQQSTNIHVAVFMPHINLVYLMMLFLTPLLTMKLFAEEKKERTMDLLLTAPITSTQIVLAKFMSAWTAVTFLLILAMFYPLSSGVIADFDYAPIWGSYLGMFLLLGVNCSLGMLASTLTSSALFASFLGFLLILTTLLMGAMVGSFNHPFWSALTEQMAIVMHIQDFFNGTVELTGIVFMISSIILFSFFAQRVVESSRWR